VRQAVEAKRAIGVAAASLVEEGQTVLLDSGTTSLEVGHRLMSRSDITIITNSPLFGHAAQGAAARIIWIGGEFRPVSGALVGPLALEWLSNLRADWAFIGASGLSAAEGASTTETSEAAVKKAMIGRAARAVLVADSSKWEKPSTVRFASWTEFGLWVCDSALPAEAFELVARQGVQIMSAVTNGKKRDDS
jgi:DeoR/GlpR family transcriptional regulator of sugar metabolism